MKKLLSIGLGLTLVATLSASAFAGPSRAIVQELGATVAAGEVNVDLNVIPLDLTGIVGTPAAPTQVGGGNATIGGSAISSVNIGLGNGFEVRTGAQPGLTGAANLTNAGVTTPMGLTVKYSGLVPGLAIYGSLGSAQNTTLGAPGVSTTTDANRFGAAYTTTAGGVVLNGNIQIGNNNTTGAAGKSVTEYAVAALYPLNANLLIGGEYLNSTVSNSAVGSLGANGFALGGRAMLGNFTVDAVIYANVNVSGSTGAISGNSAQMGNPMLLRVNYKF